MYYRVQNECYDGAVVELYTSASIALIYNGREALDLESMSLYCTIRVGRSHDTALVPSMIVNVE